MKKIIQFYHGGDGEDVGGQPPIKNKADQPTVKEPAEETPSEKEEEEKES